MEIKIFFFWCPIIPPFPLYVSLALLFLSNRDEQKTEKEINFFVGYQNYTIKVNLAVDDEISYESDTVEYEMTTDSPGVSISGNDVTYTPGSDLILSIHINGGDNFHLKVSL